jgi:hypothetical protein
MIAVVLSGHGTSKTRPRPDRDGEWPLIGLVRSTPAKLLSSCDGTLDRPASLASTLRATIVRAAKGAAVASVSYLYRVSTSQMRSVPQPISCAGTRSSAA